MTPFQLVFQIIWQTFLAWWWLILPFMLFGPAKFLWLWWKEEQFWIRTRHILLELRIPQDIEKPVKAMESVFAGLWQLYDPPNPREYWFEGQRLVKLSIEIVSIEGQVHLYLRLPAVAKRVVESAIHSQFPAVELEEVEDYTKFVPQDIPNRDWEMWGTNFWLAKPDVYPIKTYPTFFEENPEGREEKRLDPMAILLEAFSKIGKGEQLWLQFILKPITPEQNDYPSRGSVIVDKLVKRPKVTKPSSFLAEVGSAGATLATGSIKGQDEKPERQEFIPPEMKLTPGEREIVAAVERKVSKYAFEANIRGIYLAKREVYFSPTKAFFFEFFTQFGTTSLNFFLPYGPTGTKVKTIFLWFLDARRAFLKKRRIFRNYVDRLDPMYPRDGGTSILNIEEMATIFHFPGQLISPISSIPRVVSKKGDAPPGLPVE